MALMLDEPFAAAIVAELFHSNTYRFALCLQKQHPQWWNRQMQRIRFPVPAMIVRPDTADIADAAAPVIGGVAIEQFAPKAFVRHTDSIPLPRHRGKVANYQNTLSVIGLAQKT